MNAMTPTNTLVKAAEVFFFEEQTQPIIAMGNSMTPFIGDGQSITITRGFNKLRNGHCYFFFFPEPAYPAPVSFCS